MQTLTYEPARKRHLEWITMNTKARFPSCTDYASRIKLGKLTDAKIRKYAEAGYYDNAFFRPSRWAKATAQQKTKTSSPSEIKKHLEYLLS